MKQRTDLHFRKATPRATRYELADRDGLTLEVHPSGRKTWRCRYSVDGSAASLIALIALLKTGLWVLSQRSKRLTSTRQSDADDDSTFVPSPPHPSEHATGNLITEEDSCAAVARMMYGDLRDPMEDEHTLFDDCASSNDRNWDE
jgi:hypothetical protein